ncbi:hypothetical protein SAMN05444320_110127 [Streptoalloteichus hindustanus]|uniref:Uncharacterized protein n=1 Tax=Streptoalloteichus hindustanus TaxID=2017 RepID=A0A1M5L2C7_STRHI|nr:hypothetical protein SAMN05444320_110127 [Streptoalloteichus hindustanus]
MPLACVPHAGSRPLPVGAGARRPGTVGQRCGGTPAGAATRRRSPTGNAVRATPARRNARRGPEGLRSPRRPTRPRRTARPSRPSCRLPGVGAIGKERLGTHHAQRQPHPHLDSPCRATPGRGSRTPEPRRSIANEKVKAPRERGRGLPPRSRWNPPRTPGEPGRGVGHGTGRARRHPCPDARPCSTAEEPGRRSSSAGTSDDERPAEPRHGSSHGGRTTCGRGVDGSPSTPLLTCAPGRTRTCDTRFHVVTG